MDIHKGGKGEEESNAGARRKDGISDQPTAGISLHSGVSPEKKGAPYNPASKGMPRVAVSTYTAKIAALSKQPTSWARWKEWSRYRRLAPG